MKFEKALQLMKQGKRMKLPSWGGYWYWDNEKKTVMMKTKDGELLDIRETERVEYTLLNVASEDWMLADKANTQVLGGINMFNFEQALKYLKRGFRLTRKSWKSGMIIYKVNVSHTLDDGAVEFECLDICCSYLDEHGSHSCLYCLSNEDVLADDWMFYNEGGC